MVKGESFQKKHGNWMRLNMHDDYWLIMDTWNKAISLVKGQCEYDNMYTGFKDAEKVQTLGIDFGGFRLYVKASEINNYHTLAYNNNNK